MPALPQRRLWRIDASGTTGIDQARLAAGLQLHLRYAALTTVLVRIGAARQAYLLLAGCAGCVHARCLPGCRVELLRRLFTQAAPGLQLQPVSRGLAVRPYTRCVLAVPGRQPAPLDGTLLDLWDDARLVVGWHTQGRSLRAGALLAVARADPDPADALRTRGWRTWTMPPRLGRRWACNALPSGLLSSGAAGLAPGLLLPEPVVAEVHAGTRSVPVVPELDARMADWLHHVLVAPVTGDPAHESVAALPATAASQWPGGPQGLPPAALETLVSQIIAEPSFQSTRKGQSGISKGRLAALKYPGLSDAVARSLMVWFDRAGVLAQPAAGQSPWRTPRPFICTEPDAIAERLRATPLPASDDVRAAYGGEA